MRRSLRYLGLVAIALFGLSFALLNKQPVNLDYYLGRAELPLSFALVIALVLGAFLGVLTALGPIFKQRRELARLRRSARHVQKELEELRKPPANDAV